MMEQPDPRKRHSHAVPVTGLDHRLVPDRTAGLGDITDTASVRTVNIIPEREESI